ncbi:hypothetical protein [Denitromonas halophila]|uniref:Zinc ribbon domain-containing protein n=1 Tax=Denitromonas halophila TaxID=1629404 RepID=A0A557QLR0_9RHOO|nr:hypothetical protein [Denitromonas halophila]TVO53829.1 hypothetical protein FHP91_13610 [Denitromonas halophila]
MYAKAIAARSAIAEPGEQVAPKPPLKGADLWECVDCAGLVSHKAVACPHCGRPFGRGVHPVSVVDVGMPFVSMVVFLIKWALAAIPAALIIGVLYGAVLMLVGSVFR